MPSGLFINTRIYFDGSSIKDIKLSGKHIPESNILGMKGTSMMYGKDMMVKQNYPTPPTASKGILSITSEIGMIDSDIVVAGSKKLAQQYSFYAQKEDFIINKLTIINDADPSNGFNNAVPTGSLDSITITYPNKNLVTQSVTGTLGSGSYTFSNLDFYAPKGKNVPLKIYANIKGISSNTFSFSGKKFALGLKSINSKSTFKAIGVSSSQGVYMDKSGDILTFVNEPVFTVRKSKPVFSNIAKVNAPMPSSNGDLYKFTVKAEGGDVSLSRLVFEIKTKGLASSGSEDIYAFDFRKNGVSVPSVNIWGRGTSGGLNFATMNLNGPNGSTLGQGLAFGIYTLKSVDDGTYEVIVTFDNEETISKGSTQTYTLMASVSGATTDDTIKVKLIGTDENNEVNISTNYNNDNGLTNTAQLVGSNGTANDSLFDAKYAGTGANEYFQELKLYRNVIWSDRSGGDFASGNSGVVQNTIHTYPTIKGSSKHNAGTVVGSSGTVDWTNGYQLNVDKLSSSTFKQ